MGLRRSTREREPAPAVRKPIGLPILGYAEARRSPCEGCEAWCCQYLSLPEFTVGDLDELDWAVYLLNFEGIRLTLTRSGRWIPYWAATCRHFDAERHLCSVHGTDVQPHTCVRYNPYNCFYRDSFSDVPDEDLLWLDHRRMELLLTGVRSDDSRQKLTIPPFDALRGIFETMPDPPVVERPPAAGAAAGEAERERRLIPLTFEDPAVSTPCEGCAAYCCTTLLVPLEAPTDATTVDYFRYALGFPGVELVVGDGRWSFALATRCRHLEGTRCGVYGSAERPIRCEYYDAWTCTYRDTFAPGRQGDVRLAYEDLPALLSCCQFDDRGRLLAVPAPADLAAAVAAR